MAGEGASCLDCAREGLRVAPREKSAEATSTVGNRSGQRTQLNNICASICVISLILSRAHLHDNARLNTAAPHDMSYCAIDFGTSNSAVAIPTDTGMRLVPLEDEHLTMPTAVFYSTDPDDIPAQAHRATGQPGAELPRCFGRAAVQTYIEGYEGRLMRSMKSILGGPLVHQTTDLGHGHGVRYIDVITSYLRQLRHQAQTHG